VGAGVQPQPLRERGRRQVRDRQDQGVPSQRLTQMHQICPKIGTYGVLIHIKSSAVLC